ncbi:MAG: tetratricopeptide repeat protein [bacterium]|nr:tetratricopeptide repeat protein [bacterium]
MRSLKVPALGLLLLAPLTACQEGETEGAQDVAVEEIPVTTASEEARADFEAARALQDVGRYQEANPLFESAVQKDPGFAHAYLSIAQTAASAREFKDNLTRAQENLDGRSEGERLLVEITETFLGNDATRRLELAQKLCQQYPRSPRAWLVLAGVQADQNQHEAARESIQRALELDPAFLPAHFRVWGSHLFDEPKDFARAETAMLECLEIAPDEAKVHENLGDVYRAMQALDRARESYTRAVEMDPSLSVANIKKGHINSFLGNFDEARAAYDVGVEGAQGPNRITYANYRAFAHLHAGDPGAALEELAGLVAAADQAEIPQDQAFGAKIFTLDNMAMIALHNDLFDDSEKIIEELAALVRATAESVDDPDFTRRQEANILLWQGQLLARRGDYDAAREKAEEYRVLLEGDNNPRRFEGYEGVMGLIALRQGNYPEASEHIRKSNLNIMYIKYHLALAEEGAGNLEEARKLFREVAEWNFNSVGFALVRKDAMARMAG